MLRGRKSVVEAMGALEGDGVSTFCTAIDWAEIYAGIRPGEEHLTEAFFGARGEVVLDAVTGRHAGSYLARYARSHGMEIADARVAAAAVTSGLRPWTLNPRNYPMGELEFYDPFG